MLAIATSSRLASADDENIYFTLQGGRSFSTMKNIHEVGGSFESGTTAQELNLDDSNMFGAKAGIYSRKGLVGIEGEVFRTRPNSGVQTQTFFEPTFGPFPQTRGASQTVDALAINIILRQPVAERLVVHVGAGPGWFRSKLHFGGEQPQSSTRVGLNTQLGLTYFISKKVMVSAEWKHNAVTFNYPTLGTTEGFKSDYKANQIGMGISYAFDWAGPEAPINFRKALGLDPVHIGPKE